jgi:hypothetical protein
MMRLASENDLVCFSVHFKHDGGNAFASAMFSNAAVREFDSKYPMRTHIEVYVDEEQEQVGFKIKSDGGSERHVRQVSITKALRKLKIYSNIKQTMLVFDPDQGMYIAEL